MKASSPVRRVIFLTSVSRTLTSVPCLKSVTTYPAPFFTGSFFESMRPVGLSSTCQRTSLLRSDDHREIFFTLDFGSRLTVLSGIVRKT